MSGRGKVPKQPDQRLGHGTLRRGEWVVLPASNPAKPPRMPTPAPAGGWSGRAREAWRSWWSDPAALMWSPGDLEQLTTLAFLRDDLARDPTAALASEVRRREDNLGLSSKGKQDRRWRIDADVTATESTQPKGVYDGLRLAANGGQAV